MNSILLSDVVTVSTIIYHTNMSYAEGYPTIIRVITPNYLSFTDNDTFSTNYTLAHLPDVNVSVNLTNSTNNVNYFDFIFPEGITYADIVELNFTMTVDPTKKRLPGTGVEETSIVLVPVCEQYVIDAYPLAAGDLTLCGDHYPVNLNTTSPGTVTCNC